VCAVNENERDPLASADAPGAAARESTGPAPNGSDEQVGTAPGGDETVGRAPATGGRNVPVLVGGIIAVVVLIGVLIGVFAR